MCFPAISDLLLDLLRSQLFRENVRISWNNVKIYEYFWSNKGFFQIQNSCFASCLGKVRVFYLVFIFCYLPSHVPFLWNSCRRKKYDIFILKLKFLFRTVGSARTTDKKSADLFWQESRYLELFFKAHIFEFGVKIRTFYKQSRVALKKSNILMINFYKS